MLKPIRLFSIFLILLTLSFSQELEERFSLKVKVVDRVIIEKPFPEPPKKLEIKEEELKIKDFSSELLEPPKRIEKAEVEVPQEQRKGCGVPRDLSNYRKAVKLYSQGKFSEARKYLKSVIAIPNSPYAGPARYILGVIYAETLKEEEALLLFKEACELTHPYRNASCEGYYALEFKLKGKPVKVEDIDLWKKVYLIKAEGKIEKPECTDTVFKEYCSYVSDFVEGKINKDYRISTELRRAVKLLMENKLEEAKRIFIKYEHIPELRHIVLYYLGIIALKEGNVEEAYKYTYSLELINEGLAKELYRFLAEKDPVYVRIAYSKLKDKELFINSGIRAYNSGDYKTAFIEFLKAEDFFLAGLSALKEGNLEKAYETFKKVPEEKRDKEFYRWYLEVLYRLNKDEELEKTLEDIKEKFPEIYREFKAWYEFRKGNWEEASKYFDEPYYKAVALFNAGKHEEVLKVLKDRDSYEERILKARSAIALGKGKLARKFLTEKTPEEIYLKGLSYFIEGRYREAIKEFEKLKDNEKYKIKALLKIADSHYNMGNYGRAKRIYRDILKKYPNSKEAYDSALALAQIELQSPSRDLKVLIREFERRFPKSPFLEDLRYQLALIYIKEGETDKAREILEKLKNTERYRAKALLKLAEIEKNAEEKEKLLKEVIRVGNKEEKERTTVMLMALYLKTGKHEALADFLAKGDYEDKKKALEIYIEENIEKAIKLFDELARENPHDEDLKRLALKMYDNTKAKRYLIFAKGSEDIKVKAKALYLLGKMEKRRNKEKALEYFVEVILTARDVPEYYNRSILEAVDILISMNARKDASCLLEEINEKFLSDDEVKKVKILRNKLPECEVSGHGTGNAS